MQRVFRPLAVASIAAAMAACSNGQQSAVPQLPQWPAITNPMTMQHPEAPANVRPSCPGPAPMGSARCIALVRTDVFTPDAVGANISGYGPADLQAAYALPSSTAGAGQTVAIVDAYDDKHAEADLKVYRKHFNLPVCTTLNGCFKRLNQSGNPGPYPPANTGWAQEISLDLDMVSAVCPKCHILLIEAQAASFNDLAASVDTAARLGATAISNSYGGGEYPSETSDQAHFNHPGIMITASSGDSGYGPQFPAASQYVTAVGGTSLTRGGGTRGWSETVWSGAGSGCSLYVAKPSWQHDPSCSHRTIADVSAVADPNTGVAVYDKAWLVFGGTSVSSPIVAAVYALAGNGASSTYAQDSYLHPTSLFDITSGSNGSCGGGYLCTGMAGYDGPTGNGTPNGIGGF
jgi:subtilase family serine protease